jgi:hypothetical protein
MSDPDDGDKIMKFWKDNQIAGEFELTIAEVADQFLAWFDKQEGADELRKDSPLLDRGLDRLIRWWLTGKDGLSSTWEDDAAYNKVYDLVYRGIFPPGCKACKTGKGRHTCGLAGLQDMFRIG